MIRVLIDPQDMTLDVSGHAEYGNAGKDIVCAAASMLGYTLLARLREVNGVAYAHADSGSMTIRADKCRDYAVYRIMQEAFETVRAGYELLARQYPDNVDVVTK